MFPTDADLTIRMADGTPLTQDNCGIWAFGFEGQIQFEDGVIHAWTDSPLEGSQYLTVMTQLQSGLLHPQRTEQDSFQTVKDAAFQGSDYTDPEEEPLTAMDIVWMIVSLVVILGASSAFSPCSGPGRRPRPKSSWPRSTISGTPPTAAT